jgi:hypothetical protein
MGSNLIVEGAWSGIWTAPRPMKALMLACTDGAQEGGVASALGPHHIPGWNICHYGRCSGEYRKKLHS